jgi:predicted O-linked N-acetylglucosamine transferase (SPINDLY family)
VFRDQGLDPARYLKVTPWLPRDRFLGYLDAMNVYLDSPAFSGYTTAWQALHRGLPIVAIEGAFLRQRLASGLLKKIGLTDGIAQSKDQYVELACRLAEESRSAARRQTRRDTIRQAAFKADGDGAAVHALQSALLEASASLKG